VLFVDPEGSGDRRSTLPGGQAARRAAGIAWFAGAALFLALLSIRLPNGGIYVMVFLTSCFVFSAQVLVYAFVSANHRRRCGRRRWAGRPGWDGRGHRRSGHHRGPVRGRVAFPWGFYFFPVVGALGAASLAVAVSRPTRI
jgi:hypothetical protein